MARIVAMIPCRLGSQRVPKKNLRLLHGKTLPQWSAEACKNSGVFDDIYINSESDVFDVIAQKSQVKFYRRPAVLASNSATNDDFALDFMNSVPLDILIQVNPTSPFVSADDIRSFVTTFIDQKYQTLHTVKAEQIEGLFESKPLNFDPLKQMPPSQQLTPVWLFSSSIMGWDAAKFRENMKNLECAVYGGDGRTGYYVMKGIATLDIDNEFDFQLAEAIVNVKDRKPEYYPV
jgi:CMP-N-acetylneuraminic acid synthetase